jgi:hypothetical protein
MSCLNNCFFLRIVVRFLFCFVCRRTVSCVPNGASFSGLCSLAFISVFYAYLLHNINLDRIHLFDISFYFVTPFVWLHV